jgi:hypothetical protein
MHNQQTADYQNKSLGLHGQQVAETARHAKVMEGQSAATLAETREFHNKPQLVVETDPWTQEKTHTIFDPRTRTATPITPGPGATAPAPASIAPPQPSPFPAPAPALPNGPGPQTIPMPAPSTYAPQPGATPAPAPSPDASGGRNEQYFQSLRPDMQGPVKDVVEGRRTLADYPAKQRLLLERAARIYAPDWSPADSSGGLTPDAIKVGGIQIANGDLSPLKNVGRGTQGSRDIAALKNAATAHLIEKGASPEEAAAKASEAIQKFAAQGIGLNAEERTRGNREGNLNLILKATEAAIPAALEASEAVERYAGKWVPVNQIIQKGQVATSDANLRKFGMANLQLAEHWARAMNPTGVMRESDRDLALSFLSTADSKATYREVVNQLKLQITRERDAVRNGGAPAATAAPAASAAAVPAAAATPPAPPPGFELVKP